MSLAALRYALEVAHYPDGKKLEPSEKLILILIADLYRDDKGVAWPSARYLADRVGLSQRQVWNILAKLEEGIFIRRRARRRSDGKKSSNAYTLPGFRGPHAAEARKKAPSDNANRARRIKEIVPPALVAKALGLGGGPKLHCIWHSDRTPSLHLYHDGFQCFGACDKQYSVIDFVMEFRSMNLSEAIDWMESRFRIGDAAVQTLERRKLSELWAEAMHTIETRLEMEMAVSGNGATGGLGNGMTVVHDYLGRFMDRGIQLGYPPTSWRVSNVERIVRNCLQLPT